MTKKLITFTLLALAMLWVGLSFLIGFNSKKYGDFRTLSIFQDMEVTGTSTVQNLVINGTCVGCGGSSSSTFTTVNFGTAAGSNLTWVNATGTNTTGTWIGFTTASGSTLNTSSLSAANGSLSNATSSNWFGFATASGTTINAISANISSSTLRNVNFHATATFTNDYNYVNGGETAFIFSSPNVGGGDYMAKFTNGFETVGITAFGQVLGAAGDESNPTFSFFEDQDTGIFSDGVKDLSFSIDGDPAFVFFVTGSFSTTTFDFSQAKTCQKWRATDGGSFYVRMLPNGSFATSTTSCS